jgi:outer membrane protein assembly factor BamE (lipoprotein component of BamABCDE complex)
VTRTFTIATWLRPERAIFAFALLATVIFIPSCIFVAVQSVRFHHRAAQVARLQPGITREQVVAVVGRPDSESSDHSTWYYTASLPELFRLPFIEPDDMLVEFSAEGRVSHSGVTPD